MLTCAVYPLMDVNNTFCHAYINCDYLYDNLADDQYFLAVLCMYMYIGIHVHLYIHVLVL